MNKTIFAVVFGMMSFGTFADDLCTEAKQFSSVTLQNTKVTYLGDVDYEPMVQIEDKTYQLKKEKYYLIAGKIYYLNKEYSRLCFSDPTDDIFVEELKEIPDLVPVYHMLPRNVEDKPAVITYHTNVDGKLYYGFKDISVKGVRYKAVDGKYVRFSEWLTAQEVRKL